jgi:hypothetical protein
MHVRSVNISVPLVNVFFPLGPLIGSWSPYWSPGLITQFIDLSQAVWLLGRVISSSQGLYLNTGQHKHRKPRTHIKHAWPRRDSNQHSRPPSDRRLFMPQTTRLPRTALVNIACPNSPFPRLCTLYALFILYLSMFLLILMIQYVIITRMY